MSTVLVADAVGRFWLRCSAVVDSRVTRVVERYLFLLMIGLMRREHVRCHRSLVLCLIIVVD
jgi:hypothetical protein